MKLLIILLFLCFKKWLFKWCKICKYTCLSTEERCKVLSVLMHQLLANDVFKCAIDESADSTKPLRNQLRELRMNYAKKQKEDSKWVYSLYSVESLCIYKWVVILLFLLLLANLILSLKLFSVWKRKILKRKMIQIRRSKFFFNR